MAVPLIWRIAITVGAGQTAVRSAQEGSGQPGWGNVIEYFWDRLRNEGEDPGSLSTDMSDYAGYAWQVATYSEPFELRKVQVIFSVADAAVSEEDARVCTFHLLKIAGGSPSSDWVAGDFSTMDAAFVTWWNYIGAMYTATVKLDRIKVYKDGPAIVPPQVPVYDADKNIAGVASGNACPPQVAISVTEIAGSKRYWGRFYLPNPSASSVTTYGRIASSAQSGIADGTDTLYTDLKAAGLNPVVYRPALPSRETRAGSTLPARAATAWDVEKIQVDDVADVIRRRRFKYPTLRVQRDI